MKKFYTWKDIDIELQLNRMNWPEEWVRVETYSDTIEVTVSSEKRADDFWQRLFKGLYDRETQTILLTMTDQRLQIVYSCEPDAVPQKDVVTPLFRNIYLSGGRQPSMPDRLLPDVPVIAFHSYKGGVGRTLSVISFVREITEQFGGEKKVLIVDGDLEAPGLTWMAQEQSNGGDISYLDLLALLHSNGWREDLVEKVSHLAEKSVLTFETQSIREQHFFIPAYREKEQLMGNYASPEILLTASSNKFILPEFFSTLGKKLGADLVIIDLRAGLSEYSAPFIFDPRVQKYFVSSTSMQSVRGTCLILRQMKDYFRDRDCMPQILLTMVPTDEPLGEDTLTGIKGQLIGAITDTKDNGEGAEKEDEEDGDLELADYITEFEFDSRLIHQEGIVQVCGKLANTDMRVKTKELVGSLFSLEKEDKKSSDLEESRVRRALEKLYNFTKNEIVAEGSASSNMLCTDVIQRIAREFRREIPRIAVLGAKGSGKTYLYKQLLIKKSWNAFVESVIPDARKDEAPETVIVPVLASPDRSRFTPLLKACIRNAGTALGKNVSDSVYAVNEEQAEKYREEEHSSTEWRDFWEKTLLSSVGGFASLTELDHYLAERKKRVLFIVDGVETLFDDLTLTENAKKAIEALCRGLLNRVSEFGGENIGVIIFLRQDLAEDAITTNYTQFKSQFAGFELKWSQTEALRLALWIAMQADDMLMPDVPITKAPKEVIDQKLKRFWGSKLGRDDSKEAFTSRWVIAALSDFNGQLQARDIVRFLMYSTENSAAVNLLYKDRFLMPSEIRKAIIPCSNGKVEEIKQEIRSLYGVFEKLETIREEEKTLPLNLEKLPLTSEEISAMIKQGYLKIYKEQYYIPEIIRHHFGFRYQTGARPKVLALLLK